MSQIDQFRLSADTAIGLYRSELVDLAPLHTALKQTQAARASWLIARAANYPVLLIADRVSISALEKHRIPFHLCEGDIAQMKGKSAAKFFASGLQNIFRYCFVDDPHWLRNDKKFINWIPEGIQPLPRAMAVRRIAWIKGAQ